MSGEGTYRGEYLYNKDGEGNDVNVPFPGNEKGAFVFIVDKTTGEPLDITDFKRPLKQSVMLLDPDTQTEDFDTKDNPLDVSKYRTAIIFLEVTGSEGSNETLDLQILSENPATGEWSEIVDDNGNSIFPEITSITDPVRHRRVIQYGLGINLAVAGTIEGDNNPNFTLSIAIIGET